ncbi:S-adenosyl-L-methionine-dependent methyltransferase [Pelagophyceae sp. CCMP2097]|nr:S-adenosyl-L-methionine-dependent methyltransferase [Pelagophyceae sp. CCMP2097]
MRVVGAVCVLVAGWPAAAQRPSPAAQPRRPSRGGRGPGGAAAPPRAARAGAPRRDGPRAPAGAARRAVEPSGGRAAEASEVSQRGPTSWSRQAERWRLAAATAARGVALSDIVVENLIAAAARAVANATAAAVASRPVADVGANIGDISLALARHFPNRDVHAFEASPVVAEALRLKFEPGGRVQVHSIALSNVQGTATIYGPAAEARNSAYTAGGLAGRASAKNVAIGTAPVARLDGWCRDHDVEGFAFVKIDTEGFDLFVLEGMGDLLRADKTAVVLFEFNCLQWKNAVEQRHLLNSPQLRGQEQRMKQNGGLRAAVGFAQAHGHDVFFLSPTQLLQVDAHDWVPQYSTGAFCVTMNVVAVAPELAPALVAHYSDIAASAVTFV